MSNPKCIRCNLDLDPDEFSDPSDADICGYCFAEFSSNIRNRRQKFASGLNECGIDREISIQATVEIMLESAENARETKLVQALKKIIRTIES